MSIFSDFLGERIEEEKDGVVVYEELLAIVKQEQPEWVETISQIIEDEKRHVDLLEGLLYKLPPEFEGEEE